MIPHYSALSPFYPPVTPHYSLFWQPMLLWHQQAQSPVTPPLVCRPTTNTALIRHRAQATEHIAEHGKKVINAVKTQGSGHGMCGSEAQMHECFRRTDVVCVV